MLWIPLFLCLAVEPPEPVPPAKGVTLAEALALAMRQHPQLLAARARAVASEADAAAVRAQWLPRLGAMAQVVASTTNNSTATVLNQSVVDLPRIGATPITSTADWAPAASTLVALGLRQTVFDFGRITSQGAAADLALVAERSRRDGVELDVALAVTHAYFAALASRALLDAAQSGAARVRQHLVQARAAVERGLRAPAELARLQADVTRFQVGVTRAVGSLRSARVMLAAATGVAEAELDATPHVIEPRPLPREDGIAADVAKRSPGVLEAEARAALSHAQAEALWSELRPQLFVTAALSGRAGGAAPTAGPMPVGAGLIPSVPNWNVGLVLAWSIWDGQVHGRARAAGMLAQAQDQEAVAVLRREQAQALRAYAETEAAQASLDGLRQALDAAEVNRRQAEARYGQQLASALELSDAEALRTEAEAQMAIGQFEAARARAVLARFLAEKETR